MYLLCNDSLLLINRKNTAKLPKFWFRFIFPVKKEELKSSEIQQLHIPNMW